MNWTEPTQYGGWLTRAWPRWVQPACCRTASVHSLSTLAGNSSSRLHASHACTTLHKISDYIYQADFFLTVQVSRKDREKDEKEGGCWESRNWKRIYPWSEYSAVTTRTDFLVLNVVRRRRAFQVWKLCLEKSDGMYMHIFSDFPGWGFLSAGQKTPIRTSDEEIRPVVRVVWRVRFPRSKNLDNTSNGKIGACSHSIMGRYFTQLLRTADV